MTSKKALLFLLFAAAAGLMSAVSPCQAAPLAIGPATLAKDTLWSGEVLVTGDVYVPPGVTLTIAPGTRVAFNKIDPKGPLNLFGTENPYYPQAELIFRGRLIARGTDREPIVFTSAEKSPKPADWGALNFLGGSGNVVDHCRIMYAYNGVHGHGAEISVTHSELAQNAVAISVKKEDEVQGAAWFGQEADITVSDNYIHDNKGGINFRLSRAVITNNAIKGNKFFGIWQKGKCRGEISRNEITENHKGVYLYRSQGTRIQLNNIYDNQDYNIAIADQQEQDQPAPNNWFGTADRAKIATTIFDHASDPSIASVLLEPVRRHRVEDAGPKASK